MMKYWDDEFVETRDVYGGEFKSPIITPALKGNILADDDTVVGLYEFEIVKEPCAITKRLDASTPDYDTVEDMCVSFEYRLRPADDRVGEQVTTAPLPLSEMTQELKDILINAHMIF